MDIYNILSYFLIGGVMVAGSVMLASSGNPFLSGIAVIFPAISSVTYYFIGKNAGAGAVAMSTKSSMATMLLVWVPYAFTILLLSPKVGVTKAIISGIAVYMIFGFAWTLINNRYGLI